jgi:hypothetical protein
MDHFMTVLAVIVLAGPSFVAGLIGRNIVRCTNVCADFASGLVAGLAA